MRQFSTPEEAAAALGPLLDQPVQTYTRPISEGLWISARVVALGGGSFVNCYTARWTAPARASLLALAPPQSPYALAQADAARGRRSLTSNAGFFFLADEAAQRPRELSLNLALHQGQLLSAPVVGQRALVSRGGGLSVRLVRAEGELRLNQQRLRWAGSRSGQEADCEVFGNANARIVHVPDPRTGLRRRLDEGSLETPPLDDPARVDLGAMRLGGGRFRGRFLARGRIPTHQFDLVLRCPARWVRVLPEENEVEFLTVDGLSLQDPGLAGALSVGPSLHDEGLEDHPLDREPSLGSTPLLTRRRAPRLLFFRTPDGASWLRLYDGRPGSAVCPGMTLTEAAEHTRQEHGPVEGCFLDSGKTCKLALSDGGEPWSLGNRHYLRWPTRAGEGFRWAPDEGRAIPSAIQVA